MTHPDPSFLASRLVMVFGTGSIPEGLLVKGLLETEGIPVQMKGEAEGPYRMGPVSLWVPEAFEVQARLILEEASSRSVESPGD
jgi:putative signal transducing protein